MELLTPATSKLGRKYTLRPAHEDHPLLKTTLVMSKRTLRIRTPTPVDHRKLLTPIRDQGQKGYCFAFATTALKEFNCARWAKLDHAIGGYLSPDYIGWRTQIAEGNFGQDEGATLEDAMEVLRAWGACPESFLPYDASNPAHAGSAVCDVAAKPYRTGPNARVPTDPDDWAAVLSSGRCFTVGFVVPQSFEETGSDGMVPPRRPGEPVLGGHELLGCLWEPYRGGKLFGLRNHWSKTWGDQGYCYWTEDYLHNVMSSMTTVD